MRGAANEAGLQIWAYALMRNHVHMIAVPENRESISDAMALALTRYARWFVPRHGGKAELWHRRCHAAFIQTRYLWNAVRYVERNPVRVGIVGRGEDYRWSSARWHCGLLEKDLLADPASPLKGALADWSAWLAEPDSDPRFAYLRRKNRRLQEAGEPEVIGLLERALDRRIAHGEKRRGGGKK